MTVSIVLSSADRDIAFGSSTDEELAEIDIEASITRLDKLLLEAVREGFPEPGFEVELGTGLHVYPEGGESTEGIYGVVANEAERIHGRGEWIVYR